MEIHLEGGDIPEEDASVLMLKARKIIHTFCVVLVCKRRPQKDKKVKWNLDERECRDEKRVCVVSVQQRERKEM